MEEREERERQRGNRKSETRRSLSREKTGAIATTIFARPLLPSTPPDDEPESWSCDCCSHVIGPLSSSSLALSLSRSRSLFRSSPSERRRFCCSLLAAHLRHSKHAPAGVRGGRVF